MTNYFLCVTENKVPRWEPCAILWFLTLAVTKCEGKEKKERNSQSSRRCSCQIGGGGGGGEQQKIIDQNGTERSQVVSVVDNQVRNYWTECVINVICLRKEGRVLIPWAVPRIWHWWLNTNLNFSKAPRNQFVLEMLRPLCPPLWFPQNSYQLVQLTRPPVPFALAFARLIRFGLAGFVFPLR